MKETATLSSSAGKMPGANGSNGGAGGDADGPATSKTAVPSDSNSNGGQVVARSQSSSSVGAATPGPGVIEDEAIRDLKKAIARQQSRGSQEEGQPAAIPRRPSNDLAQPLNSPSPSPRDDGVTPQLPPRLATSSSMPVLVEALHPEIGRPSGIAQPGGFRRHHLQQQGAEGSWVFTPLLQTQSVIERLLDPRLRISFEQHLDQAAIAQSEEAALHGNGHGQTAHGPSNGSSDAATALLVLKSTVGGTLIVIPAAYKDAGLVSATLVMIFIAGIEIYCMALLVKCSQKLGGGSYGQIVERCLGRSGLWAVDISLIASQLGFVCTEMLYVAKNLPGALGAFKGSIPDALILNTNQVLLGQMLLAVPMAWIRHLKYFSFTNFIANVVVLLALGFLLAFACAGLAHDGVHEVDNFGPGWLIFAGTSVFSFECINFVIPMYDAHEKKETFIPILTGTLWAVVVLFILFGGLNYMRYGADTASPVTDNFAASMSKDAPWGRVMQFSFAFASLLNIPLFLFPASMAIEDKIFVSYNRGLRRKWLKNLSRTLLVFLCTAIAWIGRDHINALVAVIGSICCVPLAFVYPVISHYILFRPSMTEAIFDACIGTLGIFLFVVTTYQALKEWK